MSLTTATEQPRPGPGPAGPGRRPVGRAAPGADRRAGPDHHLHRLRGAGRGHRHAAGGPRPRRPGPVRLGVQRLHAGQRGRHRGRGREADRRGPGGPYVAGLALFAAGLLAAGLAPAMPVLVAGRALQGLGAGAVPAVAYVSIGRSLPERLRPRMMAVLSTAWVAPGVAGPAAAWPWRTCSAGAGSSWAWCRSSPSRGRWPSRPCSGWDGRSRGPPAGRRAPSTGSPTGWAPRPGAGLFLAGLTQLSGGGLAGPLLGALLVLAGAGLGLPLLRRLLPGRDPARPPRPARHDPGPRRADLRVLRRRRVRHAHHHHGPPPQPGAGRAGRDRVHAGLDGRRLGPGPAEPALGRAAAGRDRPGIVLAGQAGMALVLLPAVPVAAGIAAWTAAGAAWAWPTRPSRC